MSDFVSGHCKQVDKRVLSDSDFLRSKHLDRILPCPNLLLRNYLVLEEDPAPEVLSSEVS